MTRSQLTSTVEQNTAGATPPLVAGKNFVLNGGFDLWTRGTSFTIAASSPASFSTYLADRWQTQTGANQAITVSRQATSDTTNLPNIQYALRYQRNSGQTGTGSLYIVQSFETVNSIPLAGKTVTLSFYARAGANYSATSNALAVTGGTIGVVIGGGIGNLTIAMLLAKNPNNEITNQDEL